MQETTFEDLRPYYDSEINAAMCRIAENPLFPAILNFIYEGENHDDLKEMFRNIHTTYDFQIKVMHHAIRQIAKKTATRYTTGGFDQLDKEKAYLFISNHRDILLDSALLQISLVESGRKTSEITFGSNLMSSDFIIDIGKSNKMFKVERGGNPRDFYNHSKHLSAYIRHTIQSKNESVWIAQRNGRTKDGNDLTDQGILKMFSMSGPGNLVENFAGLNLAPMVISYEWEPCDLMKSFELYKSLTEKYVKAPGEDLKSILTGITQFKGNIHLQITKPIGLQDLQEINSEDKNEFYRNLLQLIDSRIHKNYKLFETNFIAFDLLNNSEKYLNIEYSPEAKEKFVEKMYKTIEKTACNAPELFSIFLNIYANPVQNSLKYYP